MTTDYLQHGPWGLILGLISLVIVPITWACIRELQANRVERREMRQEARELISGHLERNTRCMERVAENLAKVPCVDRGACAARMNE